jgi:hypothetical protein
MKLAPILNLEVGTCPPAACLRAQRVALTIKWSVVRIGRVVRYRATTTRLNTMKTVIEKLMDLIDAGVKDPNELRDKTLKSLSLASAVAFVPAVLP